MREFETIQEIYDLLRPLNRDEQVRIIAFMESKLNSEEFNKFIKEQQRVEQQKP